MSRFLIVGSGWRALFYIRIAKALPECFDLCGVVVRTAEKAEKIRAEYEVPVFLSAAEAKLTKPDFAVIAVNKAAVSQVAAEWASAGLPVLMETPAGISREALQMIWELRQNGAKIQVAEQYFRYPTLFSMIHLCKSGILGNLNHMRLSYAHDYHGVSLIREFLGTSFAGVRLWGREYPYQVTETDSRYGPVYSGELKAAARRLIIMEFADGKTAEYDFSGIQYHSFIRGRHILVQGTRGELENGQVRYLDEANHPSTAGLEIRYYEKADVIEKILFQGELLYDDLFPGSGFSEDEAAIAWLLQGMEEYLKDGREPYPLKYALEDAYLTILMEEAVTSPGTVIEAEALPWNR